jgi:hypothetical protein
LHHEPRLRKPLWLIAEGWSQPPRLAFVISRRRWQQCHSPSR